MALDPKLLAGGAILGYFLLKKPAKSNATSTVDDKNKPDETGKGDLNDPAGPNGCKIGLKEVKGICVDDPNLDENGKPVKNGNGNGKLTASDLYISKDCKSFTFGDKTGKAWWSYKGEKTAKQWVKSGETDPLLISFEILKKTGSCFKDFPIRANFKNWLDYNTAKFWWIEKNSDMWTLLYTVRNMIDINLFDGVETVVADPKKADYALKFGNAFNMDTLWKSLEPMAYTLLQLEANKPGSILNVKDGYDNPSYLVLNVAVYLYSLILPNIPYTEIITRFKKGWFTKQTPLLGKLWELVNSIEGQSPDFEDDQF